MSRVQSRGVDLRPVDQPRAEPGGVSMCAEDWLWLDLQVEELRARGLTSMNRSRLVRAALATMDLDEITERFAGDLVVAVAPR